MHLHFACVLWTRWNAGTCGDGNISLCTAKHTWAKSPSLFKVQVTTMTKRALQEFVWILQRKYSFQLVPQEKDLCFTSPSLTCMGRDESPTTQMRCSSVSSPLTTPPRRFPFWSGFTHLKQFLSGKNAPTFFGPFFSLYHDSFCSRPFVLFVKNKEEHWRLFTRN